MCWKVASGEAQIERGENRQRGNCGRGFTRSGGRHVLRFTPIKLTRVNEGDVGRRTKRKKERMRRLAVVRLVRGAVPR